MFTTCMLSAGPGPERVGRGRQMCTLHAIRMMEPGRGACAQAWCHAG
ncbi:hypothetical protein SXCC_01595 [Gluconacetobacter sp. SXCC-1]|nr:hypothetical protein SXCC_01595 [Gluconacetobacter sp. SXCC-1]